MRTQNTDVPISGLATVPLAIPRELGRHLTRGSGNVRSKSWLTTWLTLPSERPDLHLRPTRVPQRKGDCDFFTLGALWLPLSRLRQTGGGQPVSTAAKEAVPGEGGFQELAHLEGDLILLPSPDLQAWVVPAQFPEPLPVHGEQSTGHHGRPAREAERGVKTWTWEHADIAVSLKWCPAAP